MKTLTKEQLSRLRALANRINTSSRADFVKRLLDEKRAVLKNGDGTVSTHEMSWADDGKGNAVVFPMVQRTPDGLQRFGGWDAYDRAVQNGDTLHMSVPDATLYTENYKQVYPGFDQYAAGGDIHIKPENRGKFTALKERTGHSASWFKANGTPAQKKMAVFELNARKWNHAQGGLIRRFEDGTPCVVYDPEGVLAVPSQETGASVQEPVVSVPDISYPGDVRRVRGGSALPSDFSFTPQRVSAPGESVAVVSEPVTATAAGVSAEVPSVLPFESRAAEAAVLGENTSGLVSRQVNALKSGEDLKALQKELLEKGYYRNLPSPQITARTKDEVEALQRKLKAAGYDLGNYGVNGDGIDGRLGRRTRAAWVQYVKDHPEEALLDTIADGKLGPQTRAAARRYYQDIADTVREDVITAQEPAIANMEDSRRYLSYWLPAGAAESVETMKDVARVGADNGYDRILLRPVDPSFIESVRGGLTDYENLNSWHRAVDSAQADMESTENEIPEVSMSWNVLPSQLTRLVEFLPSDLTPESQPTFTSVSKEPAYADTWNSENYIKKNSNWLTKLLKKQGGKAGLISASLESPGRGTLGGTLYKTTPEGIVISDGYEFAADPDRIRTSDVQSESYNQTRMEQNHRYRAKNNKTQKYFIPWAVYNQIVSSEQD